MFAETPELHDLIYESFKDYPAEAQAVAQLLRKLAPSAKTVLDVACGTWEHARHLQAEHGYVVHGLDIEPAFVELARAKLPNSQFWEGDMTSFDLGVRFDAILCLFSSIGYLCDLKKVELALSRFREHLEPDGLVMVEPWFTPESWNPGRVFVHTAEADGLHVIRMSNSGLEGRVSKLDFHYLIGSTEGIEHRVEHHALGLFTREEMSVCFAAAGYGDVQYDPEGLTGRGLYIARASR
jgi:SAM-dependent methyltransferase